MERIKPIPTTYNGTQYRSRLESRWAVFLTALGEPFNYEMEGFELMPVPQTDTSMDPSIKACDRPLFYVPDFWLPRSKQWIEIKPQNDVWGFDDDTVEKAYRLWVQEPVCRQVVIVCGVPGLNGYQAYGHGGKDDLFLWCECPHCGTVGLAYQGRSDRLACKEPEGVCKRSPALDKGRSSESPRLLEAYETAATHRFDWRRL